MPRVLIVTYDFPPVGGSSVQRVAKFAKWLPSCGWSPVVLTTRRGTSMPRDDTLLSDVRDVEIHRTPALHPYRILAPVRRMLRAGRGGDGSGGAMMGDRPGPWHPSAWLVPDGKLVWLPSALNWAFDLNPADRCDVVVSSIPTPTAAVVGSMISDLWRVPHVLDYRDPWSGGFYLPDRIDPLARVERAWERRILQRARAAVCVPSVRDWLPPSDTPVVTLHNGYDEEDFEGVLPRRPGQGFVVAHVGIMWRERGVAPLIEAVRILRQRDPALPTRLHFVQVGRFEAQVRGELEALGREVTVTILPQAPHADAIAYMLGADLLYLSTIYDHIPAKTYEYLRSGTPVLGIGGTGSHLARLLSETGGARVFEPDDCAGIADYLEVNMTGPATAPPPRPGVVSKYSREVGVEKLARLLDDVVTGVV